jgi:putative ABC transport system permease protein
MLLVYRGLDGILYSTLLGQQVQVNLSAIHIITAILTCASAALTADLTVLLMVRERRREFGVLLATGWTGRAVAAEIVREGLALGSLGGLLGGFVAVALFAVGYHVWSPLLFAVCILGAVMLGMALCVLGAIYPAYLAARLSPQQVLTKV